MESLYKKALKTLDKKPLSHHYCHVIKKQTKLSYTEIGDMFDKEKSWIYKLVNETAFMIEKHGKKSYIVKFESIQKDLSLKNIHPPCETLKKT